MGVGVGVGSPPPVVAHGSPLRVNARGGVSVPVREARKPTVVLAPWASEPFQLSLAAVTVAPDWDHLAFQPCVTFWLPVNAKPRLQLDSTDALLVSVTEPWKPPLHSFVTVYATEQDGSAPAAVTRGTTTALASTSAAAPTATAKCGGCRMSGSFTAGTTADARRPTDGSAPTGGASR